MHILTAKLARPPTSCTCRPIEITKMQLLSPYMAYCYVTST